MNLNLLRRWPATMLAASLVALIGCGHEPIHGHGEDHAHEHPIAGRQTGATANGHSHGEDAQSFSGATFKEGKGITLLSATRDLLQIRTAAVEQECLTHQVQFLVHVYETDSSSPGVANDPARPRGTVFRAAGTVPNQVAARLQREMSMRLGRDGGASFSGIVERVIPLGLGEESEVIVVSAETPATLSLGTFLQGTVTLPNDTAVLTVPTTAVITGTSGPFVYVENGEAFLRNPVRTEAASEGKIEIREGLLEGDVVVTQGALDLWLIELRAVKGGQGCCPAPPVKARK